MFEGRTEGTIVPARGPSNFGWDPIIEIKGTGKTYAEMEAEEKNLVSRAGLSRRQVCGAGADPNIFLTSLIFHLQLSHRYKALDLLRDYLTKQG